MPSGNRLNDRFEIELEGAHGSLEELEATTSVEARAGVVARSPDPTG